MKFLFAIFLSVLIGCGAYDVFADTEIIGWLRIMDSFSLDPGPHPYLLWLQPDGQTTSYRLNAFTISSGVLDWSGEKVKVKVADGNLPLASSLNTSEQFLDIISIELLQKPLQNSLLQIPATERSVTLLSQFSDVATIPSETPNTGPGQFNKPQGVAVDSTGNIYVADSFNHRIQKFDSNGDFVMKFGKVGTANGEFKFPSGVAVDSTGNIYVADNNNHRIQKFDSNGVFMLKFGTNGGDGTSGSLEGEFNLPFGIAVDTSGNIYVADTQNSRIQIFDSSGIFIKMFGWGVATGADAFEVCASGCQIGSAVGNDGGMTGPRGVSLDSSGNIIVADTGAHRIQKFDSTGSFLSKFGMPGTGDGEFDLPRGVAVDTSDNIYVADTENNRIQKFDSSGIFLLKFGSLGEGDSEFNLPEGIVAGSIVIGDKDNNRIKMFDEVGNFESKIGSSGSLVHDQGYYEGIFYDNPGSLKNYYLASSYGKYVWDGAVSGWESVPQQKATYSGNYDLMLTDAIAAHESNVDFCNPDPVTNVILIFNGGVSPSANTAFGSLGIWTNVPESRVDWPTADGCHITISVSWEPDNGGSFCCGQLLDRGIGVTAHELGHNLGFEHTPPPPGAWREPPNTVYNDPYHDPNSVMSDNRDKEGPSALITGQRNDVGWMDPGNKVTVADGISSNISLDFINEPEDGINPQMIIVPLPGGTSYIIEGHREGLFNDTPQDKTGAIIYKHIPGGNQYVYLTFSPADMDAEYSLVATAGTDLVSQFDDAMLEVGETFLDNVNNVTVTAQSQDATSVTVLVSNNFVSLCLPSTGLDWVISDSCTLTQNVTSDKNITIQNNSVLTIPNNMTVFFDPTTFKITIEPDSGILVEDGGSIESIP